MSCARWPTRSASPSRRCSSKPAGAPAGPASRRRAARNRRSRRPAAQRRPEGGAARRVPAATSPRRGVVKAPTPIHGAMPSYAAIAEGLRAHRSPGPRRLRSPRRRRASRRPPGPAGRRGGAARQRGRRPVAGVLGPAPRRAAPAGRVGAPHRRRDRPAPDGPGGVPERPPVAPVPAVGDARRAGVAVADRTADPSRLRALARLPGGPAARRRARRPAVARRPPEPVHRPVSAARA